MKIKEITAEKELKIVMPSGKYMSVKAGIIAEIEQDKIVDWDNVWDNINQQLTIQASQYDASWIQTTSTLKHDKITLKIPNNGTK